MASDEYTARVNKFAAEKGGLLSQLQRDGRFPQVELLITPISGDPTIQITNFLSYSFTSSVLTPVDTFSFTFCAPDSPVPFYDLIKDGDIATLSANGIQIGQGIIDQVEVATETEAGEFVNISGRDFLSQFEDQNAISRDMKPIWARSVTVRQVAETLAVNTRIQSSQIEYSGVPSRPYLFATEPGESKLGAFQRYCEGLNIMFWMSQDGRLVVGKPNMNQAPQGRLFVDKARRSANVMAMTVTRSATSIPNIIVPIWSGQEYVQERVAARQEVYNTAEGPRRLRENGHRVPKAVVVSTPQGSDPQDLSDVNRLRLFGGDLLEAHALREIASQNVNEMIVQAITAGHYNEAGIPFAPDTTYKVYYDRGSVDEEMYLFSVKHELNESTGQRSQLHLCRLGTILANIRAKGT